MLDFDLEKTSGVRRYGVRPFSGVQQSAAHNILSFFVVKENGECNFQAIAMVVARCNIHVNAGVSWFGRNVINDFPISLVHQFHNSFSNAPTCLVSSTSNTIGMDDPSLAICKYFAL
jgi:hypothetical protein